MIEKVSKVSNPLTVIAIFAGLAEIFGTVVLPFLSDESQSTYIWFLMLFPLVLISAFFLTLNFNHKVLYAPTDFENEDNFLKLFAKPTAADRIDKIHSDIDNQETSADEEKPEANNADLKYRELLRRTAKSTHYFAEELVLTKLAKEFDDIEKEVLFNVGDSRFLFDGIARKSGHVNAIEVKYIKDQNAINRIRQTFQKLERAIFSLPDNQRKSMSIILALASDMAGEELESFKTKVRELESNLSFDFDIRYYNLESLEEEILGAKALS